MLINVLDTFSFGFGYHFLFWVHFSMKIIDFHTHSVYYETMTEGYKKFLTDQGDRNLPEFIKKYKSPREFLNLLDENRVEYAVVMTELSPITTGMVGNDFVHEFCQASPRLIPFASINPYLVYNTALELERLVAEIGFKGLKLYPTHQYFYANEPLIYPIYSKAQELKIPVMLHTGSSVFPGTRLKYGDPLYLDDVAVDFPELTIIMSHCGRPFWYDRASFLARLHKNIFLDISGLPPQKLLTYIPEIERLSDKIVFGSDWPAIENIEKNIKIIEELSLSKKIIEKILGGNAARILGLKL